MNHSEEAVGQANFAIEGAPVSLDAEVERAVMNLAAARMHDSKEHRLIWFLVDVPSAEGTFVVNAELQLHMDLMKLLHCQDEPMNAAGEPALGARNLEIGDSEGLGSKIASDLDGMDRQPLCDRLVAFYVFCLAEVLLDRRQ